MTSPGFKHGIFPFKIRCLLGLANGGRGFEGHFKAYGFAIGDPPLDAAAVDRCNGFLVDAFAENFDLEPVVTKVAGRSEPLPASFLESDSR